MPNIVSSEYRDQLAQKLGNTPKDQREGVLEEAKQTPDYWIERNKAIESRQDEEIVDDGLGIFVRKKTLYHGSYVSGIKSMVGADEYTIGIGLYCTSQAKDAIGYARRRARQRNGQPFLYEGVVENLKLCDLRNDENVNRIMSRFSQFLENEKNKPDIKWNVYSLMEKVVSKIKNNEIKAWNLKEIGLNDTFTRFMQSQGYDGLIAFEGGEEKDIGRHDTYLIFHPEKVKVNKEQRID